MLIYISVGSNVSLPVLTFWAYGLATLRNTFLTRNLGCTSQLRSAIHIGKNSAHHDQIVGAVEALRFYHSDF